MTAQIIDIATRRITLVGPVAPPNKDRVGYSLHVYPLDDGGFEWDVESAVEPDPDDVAADLASIALSLSPPPRTFLERLKALFTGD